MPEHLHPKHNTEDPSSCNCLDCGFEKKLHNIPRSMVVDSTEKNLGYIEAEHVESIIKTMLRADTAKGCLTLEQLNEYQDLLLRYKDAFGTKKSVTKLSDLPPMKVYPKKTATPFCQHEIRLNQVKKEALREKIKDLLRIKMIKSLDDPLYGSAIMMVPKKNGTWRLVVDLRKLNDMCEETALKLPELQFQMEALPQFIMFMACFDCLSGFDLLRTHPDCLKFFGIVTFLGNFCF